ncbi:DUF4352 domain-containing protein [Staphylococcus kloosii]|uniref:DUF4352 domain-containing protein n=1 Tax=Staphylococcus kloosii TaxID=29384 RepID=UPI0028A4E32B|nr:DUF4352 domain-containing protein [Staphylococcus kloosii]MDT3959908.1 DUF4352 domain-containing protein [Staphylococcus kloosii]
MKKILFMIVSVLFLLVACSTGDADTDSKDDKKKSDKLKASNKMKTFKIGQVIDADGVDIKLDKVEYVTNYDEYSAPENGKAVKVYLKFKNNNDDQVLMDSSDFTMKVNNENYEQWYGNEDVHDGFTHQLNKGNTASGYITYDVPDSNTYTLEMDASPKFANVKAKWEIKKSDIKGASNSNHSTNENSNDDVTTTNSTVDNEEESDSDSDEITYTAEEYNDLVDEYNGLTDGEKMDHVTREVTEIEYTQLEDRIEKLYDQQADEADKEYQKEMDELDKQEKADEEQQAKEDKEFEELQKKEEEEYQKELDEEAKQEAEDEKAEKAADEQQEKEDKQMEEQL